MKKHLQYSLTLFCMALSLAFTAQNEAQKWYFGSNAGLDFATSPPTVLSNGMLMTYEGCASISSGAGSLLFYTDGITVYNQTHAVMANGSGLNGNSSSTQSGIIVKKPGSATIYYIFTQEELAGPNGLCYSEVDMSLAAGLGSVTVKNYSLYTPSCEKITAVRHCNGTDAWVVTHDWNSANFRSYLVTAAGVSLTPVISVSGAPANGSTIRTIGQMKISPNGRKLGLTIYDGVASPFELHDFDPATGIVSNPLVLGNFTDNYGCEFSPDGTKFYGGRFTGFEIFQWNLCAGSNTAIIASQHTILTSTLDAIGSLQLAPDGKIYITRSGSPVMSIISAPNAPGAACNYVDVGLLISPGGGQLGLPNFINSFFKAAPSPFTYSVNCQNASFIAPAVQGTVASGACSFATNSITSMNWNFGEPSSGAGNTSTLTNPAHTYASTGTYTVTLIVHYTCSSDTVKIPVSVTSVSTMSLSGTFTICAKDKRVYTASGASNYTWTGGVTTSTIALSPTVTTAYTLTGAASSSNTCANVKIFTITVNKCTGIETADNEGDLKIYPNPSNGILTIETDRKTKVLITDAVGKIMSESVFEAGVFSMNIKDYQSGIYIIKSTSGKGTKIIRLVKTE